MNDREAIFIYTGIDIFKTGKPAMYYVPVNGKTEIDLQPDRLKRSDTVITGEAIVGSHDESVRIKQK